MCACPGSFVRPVASLTTSPDASDEDRQPRRLVSGSAVMRHARHPDRSKPAGTQQPRNCTASRRFVFTRSPGLRGIIDGATTVHRCPISVRPYPVGPASQQKGSHAPCFSSRDTRRRTDVASALISRHVPDFTLPAILGNRHRVARVATLNPTKVSRLSLMVRPPFAMRTGSSTRATIVHSQCAGRPPATVLLTTTIPWGLP
jgi:hypothetical protein